MIKEEFDIGTPQFVIAFKDNDLPQKGENYVRRDAEMSVLCEMLFGKSSALYNELYEENLINDSFSSGYEGELTYAFLSVSGESKDPDGVYNKIKKRVDEIKKEGFSKEAFERAKRVCYGRALKLLDSQESFANEFVRFALKDADLLSYPKIVAKISEDEIKERLSKLDTKKCVLSAVYPKGGIKK